MTTSNNKRIAKNTFFLYIRMLLMMGATLYTSRVVLEVLGIEDYGIYNLVAGVVVLFTFLSTTMTTATQRYFCTLIGRGEKGLLQEMFSSSLIAHLLLILLLVVIAETLGLWFINTQLVIPPDRHYAALIVYQLSIAITVTNVYRIPFNAAVLSYERMSFYAYTGIVEVFLKLAILWPLSMIKADKLVLYVMLLLAVNVIVLLWYIVFVHTRLESVRHRFAGFKSSCVTDIFKFAGWSSFSAFANVGSRQGLNFLVNIFYGVTLNASIGVMNQVSSAVFQFIGNFQSAVTPPLIKDYANGEFGEVRKLLILSSKFSFFLLLLLITPIIFNIDKILGIWLTDVPPLTSWFCVFSLISLLPNTIGGPVWTVMQASGRIKRYQIVISAVTLLNIPVYYLLLKLNFSPQSTVLVQFVTNMFVVFVGTRMGLGRLGITVGSMLTGVVIPCFLPLLIGWTLIFAQMQYLPIHISGDFFEIVVSACLQIVFVGIIIAFVGLSGKERELFKNMLLSRFRK